MLWKCCTQYASKFGNLSSGHRNGKCQVLFQSQKNGMPKKVQTTAQLIVLISYTSKLMLKILQARLQQYIKWELPDNQAGFRKEILDFRTRDQITNICWIIKKSREFQKKHLLLSALLTMPRPLTWMDNNNVYHNNCVENSSRDGNTRPPCLHPKKSVCRSRSKS